jgi:Xaa-Pro dipeptidase
MDYPRRIHGLQQVMRQEDIDLVLYGPCPNYQYLTGLLVDWRSAPDLRPEGDLLLVPQEGEPVLIASGSYSIDGCPMTKVHPYDRSAGYLGMLNSIVKDLSLDVRKLGLGAYLSIPAVAAALAATERPGLCDASHLMDGLRMIKEPEEVDLLRKVARLTDDVMGKVVRDIREGVSQMDLMLEMEAQARRMGASDVSFGSWACFVHSGSSATTQGSGSTRVTDYPIERGLVANTAITFDVGFVMNGYCSDWGRSVYWGTPPDDVRHAYAALCSSVIETVAEMKNGAMRACDVYPAIEKRLDACGFGDQMRARLAPSRMIGHQIGTEVHENPWLKPESQEPLRAGMVMCIEPKLWVPGEYYLRLEEMVHVTETGAEFLTQFDRELFAL